MRKFLRGLIIARLWIREWHIDDQDDLLPKVIKSNDLVKKHQIHILKRFGIQCVPPDRRFAVFEVVIREIPDKTAGKGGKMGKAWTFVLTKNLAEVIGRMVGFQGDISDVHLAVKTTDLQLWVKAQKGVASPSFIFGDGFQKIAVKR